MRIWGYILVVLNVAAAGAFIYFATAVWKARTEWQYALLKQQLVNRGLPLDAPKEKVELDEGQVPFDFTYDATTFDRISKKKLTTLVPKGGDVLGVKGDTVVPDQTAEVKRVEKLIFDNLDSLDDAERRVREMILLLNLAQNNGRAGVHALLRDFPVEKRRAVARREMAMLGRSAPQQSVLSAIAALGEDMIGQGPNVPPEDRASRELSARKAIMAWAYSEVPNVVPEASLIAPKMGEEEGDDKPAALKERDRLLEVLNNLRPVMESAKPDPAELEKAKERLEALRAGDEPLQSKAAPLLLPYLIAVATNPVSDTAQIESAKAELLKLVDERSTTDSERKSMHAVVDLMVPPADGDLDDARRAALTGTAATELLRSYFEDAAAPASTDLAGDDTKVADFRTKLLSLKPVRTVAGKRRAIAHVLYHVDAHVGVTKEERDLWYKAVVQGEPYRNVFAADPGFAMAPPDEAALKARADWHKRVAAVVGLETYVAVVEDQATQLHNMIDPLRARISEEQSHFETEYQNVISETRRLANDLEIRQELVRKEEVLRQDAKQLLESRLVEMKKEEDKLAAATARARKSLEYLEGKVDELYQITRQLGEAQDALVVLEAKLRELELPASRTNGGDKK